MINIFRYIANLFHEALDDWNNSKIWEIKLLLALSLKCKISAIWLVETACIFLIFLIVKVQMLMECEMQESKARCTKYLNLY